MRYVGGLGAISLALALTLAGGTAASTAQGEPRLAYVREGEPLQGEELLTVDPGGEHLVRLLRGTGGHSLTNLSWSGDGTRIAIGSGDGIGALSVPKLPVISTVSADGGARRWVRGTERGSNPIFSPNGESIAFAR